MAVSASDRAKASDGTERSRRARPRRAVVVIGGEPLDSAHAGVLPADSFVIAADSGLDLADRLGWRVDLAVGDFDSASPRVVEQAEATGVAIERHPSEKERTDLDLALEAALASGAEDVVVVGGAGGRLDHLLGNLVLLASPRFARLGLEARIGPARVRAVTDRSTTFSAEPGALVSLFAMGADAEGVTTAGLRYPLRDERLCSGSSRGLSNVHVEATASVSVRHGSVLVVHPDPASPSQEDAS